MEILSNQNITLSQLLAKAQERVKDEVLKFLKHTLEELLETLRSEVVRRGKYERKFWKLAEQLLFSFAQGMSLRSLQVWLGSLDFGIGCASTLGKVMEKKVQELRVRQRKPLHSKEYRALVLDGVWFKKRKEKKKEVLLVALGVRLDGSSSVLA
ncbi:hypothetical protein M15_03670 [Atrimonas thermophila]